LAEDAVNIRHQRYTPVQHLEKCAPQEVFHHNENIING
jgi:hypothetical protein